MTRTMMDRTNRKVQNAVGALIAMTLLTVNTVQAQSAIGVPFAGRNHLSVSATDLSRDGIGKQRATVFGAIYGRRLGGDSGRIQYSAIVRTALRAVNQSNDGIVDVGVTLAATRRLVAGLSVTGAAGASAVVWGQQANGEQPDRGRVVARTPLSLGMAYDIQLGALTISPFSTVTGGYSSEREYVNEERVNLYTGWRFSNSSGVSVRLNEMVLTFTEIARERGMPNKHRMLFTAGMSW